MFVKHNESGFHSAIKGVDQKTLVHGQKTLMTEFLLHKGHSIPRHSHPHEQTGYLVTGHIILTIGNEKCDARPGDSWCIAGGVGAQRRYSGRFGSHRSVFPGKGRLSALIPGRD